MGKDNANGNNILQMRRQTVADEYKVLIVDDNEINAMLAAELIEAFGLSTVVADSGTAAIGCVREQEFAFVLMDHIMPGMNGVEATGIIHGMSNVPIYAMTGDLTEKVAAEFAAAGAQHAISKPLKPQELYKIVTECVPEGNYTVNKNMLNDSIGETLMNLSDEDGRKDTLRSFMGTVTGLDYTRGLSNSMGNETGYLRLLKASSNNIRQYVTILHDYLVTAEPDKLKLASHSLKTVFANIGFEQLRRESEVIEAKAGELLNRAEATGSIAVFDEEHQERINEYITHTMNAALELDDALAGYEQATRRPEDEEDYNTIEEPLNVDDMTEVIEYTENALKRFELDYLIEGLTILAKASAGEERKKIKAAIDAANDFKYDDVRDTLDEVVSLKKGRGEAR